MKYRLSICTVFASFLILVTACGPSQQELAAKKIMDAGVLLAKGDTVKSLLILDSIQKLYPEASSEGQKAIQMSNKLYGLQLTKQRENLAAANTLIASLIKEFKSEKGEFDRYTNYIPARQVVDKSWSRSFIQVSLNEKGDLTLASNYYGEHWLNHTSFRIAGEGIPTAKTDSVPLDNPDNHRSEFNGAKWEKVTYKGPQAERVIATIVTNWKKRMKAVFTGIKTTYIIWLEDYDKNAIKSAYDLSKAFQAKREAEKIIPVLEKKIKS